MSLVKNRHFLSSTALDGPFFGPPIPHSLPRLAQGGRARLDPGKEMRYALPRFHAVHLYDGPCHLTIGDHGFEVAPGTLSYTPWAWVSVYRMGPWPMSYRWIHFEPGPATTGAVPLSVPLVVSPGASLGEATALFEEALALRTLNSRRGEVKLLDLLHLMAEAAVGGEARLDARLRLVSRAMETRLSETLSLPLLADLAGITPDHLNRLWKKATGHTVMDHLRDLRLKRAAWHLRHSTMAVLHVAAESGYRDLQVFNKAFRQRFGVSPRAWRNGEQR